MRFVLFKILLELSRPLTLVLLLLTLVIILFQKKKTIAAQAVLLFCWISLFIMSNQGTNHGFIASLEHQFPALSIATTPTAEAIVVLGGTLSRLTPPRIQSEESKGSRLAYAVRLFQQGKGPLILVSGGSPYKDIHGQMRTESLDMKDYLISFSVPENQILEENQSRNTEENALYSARLLKERNIKKIILVTSAFHLPRAMTWFKKYNLEIIPFPTDFKDATGENYSNLIPNAEALVDFSLALKEYLGILTLKVL